MDVAYLEKTAPKNPNDKTAAAALPPMSVRDIAAMHQKAK
jgi:hypothetical protein